MSIRFSFCNRKNIARIYFGIQKTRPAVSIKVFMTFFEVANSHVAVELIRVPKKLEKFQRI